MSATTTDLALIEELVKGLDADPSEDSAVLVLPLRYGNAENLSNVLTAALVDTSGATNQGVKMSKVDK